MSFIADKQTLEDLNVLGKYKNNSIFNLFNQVQTSGGEKLLETMFKDPLTDAAAINMRSEIFSYFQEQELIFPFDKEQFGIMENYLHDEAGSSVLAVGINTLKKQLLGFTVKDEAYQKMLIGIQATITIIHSCKEFMRKLNGISDGHPYRQQIESIQTIFHDKQLLILPQGNFQPGFAQVVKYEHLFRHRLQAVLKTMMEVIYHLDVYIAVGNVAKARGFTYAQALPKEKNVVRANDLRHPALDKAIGNGVSFHQNRNLIFLTGANMAGKSTFMKSFGITLYLAHMGFPVAAKETTFSVRDGIYSSINVPDNLNMGLSHFYAEVLRVKKVAEEVADGKDLIVIFDELFKGTNVKDAYDATLTITEAFSEYRNCLFIISTHIIEVGEALRQYDHIHFLYLPTVMEGNIPRYTYRLKEGITTDRQGMMIIENEGILDIISERKYANQ